MSSREIADICGARHNDVIATIDRLFDQGILQESRNILRALSPVGRGHPIEVYDVTKRDTLVVVSGYNADVRAKIIDRWQEPEVWSGPRREISAMWAANALVCVSSHAAIRSSEIPAASNRRRRSAMR
jgi:phage regulator Rha-like protein